MTKLAASETTDNKEVRKAKRAFFVSLFDLSWRMLASMLLPIFLGLYIDSKRGGQLFAYIGFAIGMVGGALVMRSVVRKLAK